MRPLLSLSSRNFIASLNNPYVERAAADSLHHLIRHNMNRGIPDPEAAGLRVLERINSFPLPSIQPHAVFNSGGNRNFRNREDFLNTHPKSAYGDWHLESTKWIHNKIHQDYGDLRLSLFNFNSALMAKHAALDGKNIIPFTEGLSVIKSPHSIWASSECTSILYESLNNPKAGGATLLGMDVSIIARSIGSQHLDNPAIIYPLSDSLGKFVGDGKHFDLRILDGKEMSITVPNGNNQTQRWDTLLSKDPSPNLLFYFHTPKERLQDASSVQLTPPSTAVPTSSSGPTQPVSVPDPHAIVVGPLPTQTTVTAPAIVTQPLINDRTHPDHKLFEQALAGVNQLDRQQHRASDVHSEQLAAALAVVALRNDLKQIDRVELSKDNAHVFAIQGDPKAIDHRQISVNTLDGLNTPIEKSSQTLEAQKAQATPKRDDLRHPEHPAHAEFQGIRQLVNDLHARHGVPLSEEQRDRLAAAIIHDAHNNQLGPVKELRFSEDKTGKIQPDGNVFAFNGDPAKVTTLHSATHIPLAQETPVEQSFKQMAKAVQQPQQQQQQQAAQSQSPGTPASSHPGGR
jgi:hypothetical protein